MSWTQKITTKTVLFDTSNSGGLLDVAPSTTTLAAAITTTGQTAVTLTSGTHAVNGAYIKIGSEWMLVQSGGGTANIVVTRGANGTTAATYSSGATVNLPGSRTATLLAISQVPERELFLHKSTGDINYVAVTTGVDPLTGIQDTFTGGGTVLLLIDNSAANGTAHLKQPGAGTEVLVMVTGGVQGAQGPPGAPGGSATPPGNVTIGTVTAEWVVISA
jgi:hypothetical protein